MDIRVIDEEKKCHYCREHFNGVEEGLVQILPNGEESYYHLRCIGKLCVYRIEGVLPKHLFEAVVTELKNPLPVEDNGQTTLDDFQEEE
tara:strand:- start:1605 stop:1871 length:267 start_codon:yes stop_codon:yes gene_type:complete